MEEDTVLGAAHTEFADTPVDVLGFWVLSAEAWVARNSGLDGAGNVGGTAKGEWALGLEGSDDFAAGVTAGVFGSSSEFWDFWQEFLEVALHRFLEAGIILRMFGGISLHSGLMGGMGFGTAFREVLGEVRIDFFRNGEGWVVIGIGFLGFRAFFGGKWVTMALAGAFFWRTVTDSGVDDDHGWRGGALLGFGYGLVDRFDVIAVGDFEDVPFGGLEAEFLVFG